ncbi:tungstate ABC transporter substrate-binding protein WtpA [Candidatus Bathyarchaeota archaeon]|nr:MAG: tungstate ABC transporter substrate-binding protein WtpA [Candidatus Bathyarchaeota archaeon]
MRGKILLGLVLAAVVALGLFLGPLSRRGVVLRVFCAGSLTLPLEEIKGEFERQHQDVRVEIEPSGSVACVRKVVEVGKAADVVAVADHRLIPTMMMPEHADWYIVFATNQMVLAYSNSSRHAGEVNSINWYEVLRDPEVRWGFSNPNIDPCGYRALMVIQLAEWLYNDSSIFDDLIIENTAIKASEEGGRCSILVLKDLEPNSKRVTVRDKSVDLLSLLEEGGLDYAFEYLSVAVQHNLNYVVLPPAIDLSDLSRAEEYGRVVVTLASGENIMGAPITYGVTIPKNAPNRDLAEEFIEFLIGDPGREVFSRLGQPSLSPAVASDLEALPPSLRPYCEEASP